MRIGLIAALRRSQDGALRAALPLAGRSVIARQAALLQSLGAERVLCLTEVPDGEIIAIQHTLESKGVQFHALKGFAALPALVRAEDELIVLLDGLVPDTGIVQAVLSAGPAGESGIRRVVATIPADHPLAAAHPDDFERIDAARHWAGMLAMRGAPVQQLADFPADADAISLLLRLALQAGTPPRSIAAHGLVSENWLLADSAAAAVRHEAGLIARAAMPASGRAPGQALAAALVFAILPRGLGQGAQVAGALALSGLLAGLIASAFGLAAAGLAMAGLGAFGSQVARNFATLAARLGARAEGSGAGPVLGVVVDGLAALALWFAIAPLPEWQPLAVTGPLLIGLARLAKRDSATWLGAAAADRSSLLLLLALAAVFGVLPETLSCLALGLLAALLLRGAPD